MRPSTVLALAAVILGSEPLCINAILIVSILAAEAGL